MSAEDVKLMRRAWKTMVERDPAGLDYLADDLEFHVSPDLRPETGVYRGREGYLEVVRGWWEVWDERGIRPAEFIDGGAGKVMVVVRASHRSRLTGLAFESEEYFVYVLRDGKIATIRWERDRDAAFRALADAG